MNKKKFEDLEISIQYEELHFDDIIYIFNSLLNTTRNFYDKEEYWFDGKVYNYLNEEFVNGTTKEDYYKSIESIKKTIKKSVTYKITEFEQGSLKLKVAFVISEGVLVSLISAVNLPAGITIGTLQGIAMQIYSEHEEDFDERLSKLRKRWLTQSEKRGRDKRKIQFRLEKKNL